MKIVHFHNPGSPNVEQYKDMFAEHGIASSSTLSSCLQRSSWQHAGVLTLSSPAS